MDKFTPSDIKQIKSHGLELAVLEQQLRDFKTGFPYADIESAAVIGNGVLPMLGSEYVDYYKSHQNQYNIVKFVPASGAATRMFKDLFEFLSSGEMNKTTQTV